MKKNEVFKFTAPNGVKVTAVVVDCLGTDVEGVTDSTCWYKKYLCYAKNRLFYHTVCTRIDEVIDDDFVPSCDEENNWYYAILYHSHEVKTVSSSQEILVDYCILPEYDTILELANAGFEDEEANILFS